jgi:hypothetical protein
VAEDLTPGPALDCDNDGFVPVSQADADKGVDCPLCGEYAGEPVVLSECSNGPGCDSTEHDFGVGMHVVAT